MTKGGKRAVRPRLRNEQNTERSFIAAVAYLIIYTYLRDFKEVTS